MTPKQAKEILLSLYPSIFTASEFLSSDGEYAECGGYVSCVAGKNRSATIEGKLTADQLEAIVTWMRDPKGVAEA